MWEGQLLIVKYFLNEVLDWTISAGTAMRPNWGDSLLVWLYEWKAIQSSTHINRTYT